MQTRVKSRVEQLVEMRIGEDVPTAVRRLYAGGMTQGQIAEHLGVGRQAVTHWMRDWGIPTRDRRALAGMDTEAIA